MIYDLEPLVQAALAARAMGEGWFNASAANGASLAQAVAWCVHTPPGRSAIQNLSIRR